MRDVVGDRDTESFHVCPQRRPRHAIRVGVEHDDGTGRETPQERPYETRAVWMMLNPGRDFQRLERLLRAWIARPCFAALAFAPLPRYSFPFFPYR